MTAQFVVEFRRPAPGEEYWIEGEIRRCGTDPSQPGDETDEQPVIVGTELLGRFGRRAA